MQAEVSRKGAGDRLEKLAQRGSAVLERYALLLLAAMTVLFFWRVALFARAKPFWFDELFTVFLARLPLRTLWKALNAGADGQPPLSYILVRAANLVFGENEIASRLPSMAGYWTFCLSLFVFTRRRYGIYAAFAALMLPFSSGAWEYSTEARPYGLVLGFTGIALCCWQRASESGGSRKGALAGLALALAAANFSHYYAVLLFMPFAGAELWRAARRRRLDVPIFLAMFAGSLTVPLCYPFMRALGGYRQHGWAEPHLYLLINFYQREIGLLAMPALVFLCGLAAWALAGFGDNLSEVEPASLPEHEMVAAILFLAIPAVGLAMALLVTRMFTARYFLAALAGLVLLVLFAALRAGKGSALSAALLMVAAAGAFVEKMALHPKFENPALAAPLLVPALQRGPLVMDDPLVFLQTWYYLPPEWKARVMYLAEPSSAAALTGADTADLNVLALRRWSNIPVVDYKNWWRPDAAVQVYHDEDSATWLERRLLLDHADLRTLAVKGGRSVLDVRLPHAP